MIIKYKVLKANRQSIIVPYPSKFCLKYDKGSIVKCVPHSIGIMVFDSHYSALDFSNGSTFKNNLIIKVRPIGRTKPVPPRVAAFNVFEPVNATKSIDEFNTLLKAVKYYSGNSKISIMFKSGCTLNTVPLGTKCYPAVEVLE